MMFFLSSRKQQSKQVISLSLDSTTEDVPSTSLGGCYQCSHSNERRRRRNINHNSNSSGRRSTDRINRHQQEIVISPPQIEKLDQVGWENFPVVMVDDSLSATPPSAPPLPFPSQARSTSSSSSSSLQLTTQKKKKANNKNKKVQFIAVHVREHSLTVGEHDWCDGRLPLSLDWAYAKSKVYHVDYYELLRDRKGRLPKGQLPKLDYYQRQQRLRRVSGYTTHELEVLEQQAAQRVKQQQQEQQKNQLKKSKTVTYFARDHDDRNTIKTNKKKNSTKLFVPLNYFGNLEASQQ